MQAPRKQKIALEVQLVQKLPEARLPLAKDEAATEESKRRMYELVLIYTGSLRMFFRGCLDQASITNQPLDCSPRLPEIQLCEARDFWIDTDAGPFMTDIVRCGLNFSLLEQF